MNYNLVVHIFSCVVDCRCVAQITDFGRNGPNVTSRPWRRRFRGGLFQFSPQKITVVTLESKLSDGINRFYFSTFFDFLAVSDAMVDDENGVRR
jgi:hypothetical protein